MILPLQPLIFLLFAFMVIEQILLGIWRPIAFRSGIVVFRRDLNGSDTSKIDPEAMETRFRGRAVQSILFRRNGEEELFFREKLFSFSFLNYTPIMHGIIETKPDGSPVLYGRLSWSSLLFAAIWYVMLSYFQMDQVNTVENGPPSWFFYAFAFAPIVVFGLIYLVQRYRYGKVAAYISEGHGY
jgi:hypothetical protein